MQHSGQSRANISSQPLVLASAGYAIIAGVLTLVGWSFNLQRLTDWKNDGISMFPNPAFCAVLSGMAILLHARFGARARTIVSVLGACVASVGALTLVEHVFSINLGIDTLFFKRAWGLIAAVAPMRMGPPATISFTMIGLALVLLNFGKRTRAISMTLGIIVASIASLSLVGYLYGAQQMYTLPRLTGIAMQTASIIFVLAVGLTASLVDLDPMRTILEPSAAGTLARRGLPVIVLLVLLMGGVRIFIQNRALADSAFGTSARTVIEIILLTAVLWWAVAMVRDHERALKENESELRGQKNQLAAFFETAAICLHRVGPDGTILWANQAELNTLGYTREEYIGQQITKFHVDQDRINDILARLHRGEKLHDYEAQMRCKDGAIKDVLIDSSVLWDEGRFVHTQCFTRDVTERKKAQEAQAQLAAIVQTSGDAIVSKSLDGIIRSWNGGAERLFGYNAAEAVGKSIELIIPPELHDEERTILARLRRGERIEHFETIRVSKSGTRIDISLTLSPIRDELGRIIGASKVARDVTERKHSEREQAQAARRKDEFLATLAHELRNPLAPLRNGLEMLGAAGHDPEMQRENREMMQRQLNHMVRLVNDLLDVGRISRDKLELRKERIALASVVAAAIETIKPQIEEAGVALEVSLPAEPIYLDADPMRLAQVFGNVLANSAKYTRSGGQIRLTANLAASEVVIEISDNGMGIPSEMLPRVFDMFTQVSRSIEHSHGGLGIGLTLVKRLVEMHGGTVAAHSEGEDRGSTFTIRLPVMVTGETRASNPTANTVEKLLRKILVVDDNRDAARSLSQLLKFSGSETQIAYDGLEAIEKAQSYRPDVVLLDIGLPKMNGYDACRAIRAQICEKQPLIVALTGWGQDEDRQRSKDAGFDAHLVKPIDYAQLTKMLKELDANGA